LFNTRFRELLRSQHYKIQSRQYQHHNTTDGKQQGNGEIQSGTEGHCEVSKEPHTNHGAASNRNEQGRGGIEGIDDHLSLKVAGAPCMETVIEEFLMALETACRISFRIMNISQKATSNKSVPWWTQNLTILRKKVNAQRRKFQLTKDHNDLRDHWNEPYVTTKAE